MDGRSGGLGDHQQTESDVMTKHWVLTSDISVRGTVNGLICAYQSLWGRFVLPLPEMMHSPRLVQLAFVDGFFQSKTKNQMQVL
ncbi:hypothetical protein VTI74DRAFT_1918 [Chaetomium olivicolor]